MDTKSILSRLKAERNRINQAISALEALGSDSQSMATPAKARRGRRRLSASARKRISEAAKKRWAAFRAKNT
jgi:hypothetical protein